MPPALQRLDTQFVLTENVIIGMKFYVYSKAWSERNLRYLITNVHIPCM